jgi:hypothetical protein
VVWILALFGFGFVVVACSSSFIIWSGLSVWFGLVFYFILFYSQLLAAIIHYLILFLLLLLLALALPLRFFLSSLPLLTVYQCHPCPPINTTIRSLLSGAIAITHHPSLIATRSSSPSDHHHQRSSFCHLLTPCLIHRRQESSPFAHSRSLIITKDRLDRRRIPLIARSALSRQCMSLTPGEFPNTISSIASTSNICSAHFQACAVQSSLDTRGQSMSSV